ncbi:MAG TPA: TIGR04255 family protein [Anaerolineae bacterium]|nr:TIGR04255 family protein [Anaerolineae bacterium]
MSEPHHLRSAPITEAIIDFRVKARPSFHAQEFSALKSTLVDRFPKVEERRGGKVTFQLSPGSTSYPAIEDIGLQGYFFKSPDDKLVAQFRIDGFTLNRLKPYTSWKELHPVATELWQQYCKIASPEAITRVALRYINHIPLPSDLSDFGRYLRAAPSVPSELPQYISAFFSRVTIHDPDKLLAAHVVQALETDAAARRITLILDIDAFQEVDMPPRDPALETTLDQLRNFKNLIFFSYLTDETLRHFE